MTQIFHSRDESVIAMPQCILVSLCAAVIYGTDVVRVLGDDVPLTVDRVIREKIENVANAIRGSRASNDVRELFDAINSLATATRANQPELVRQLILFDSEAKDEREAALLLLVCHHARISGGPMATAVIPLVGRVAGPKIDKSLRKVLMAIETPSPNRPPDFSYYDGYIASLSRPSVNVNPGLAMHMFDSAPGEALQSFASVLYLRNRDKIKSFLWARHVVDDAIWKRQYGFVPPKEPDTEVTKQLDAMAAREEWWARLYAAEVVRQHPEFGNADLVKKLAADSNELVAKAASQIARRPMP